MGQIHASIELINLIDFQDSRRLIIDTDDVRKITVSALVDTGALFMCINENIQEYLQLPIVDYNRVELADGRVVERPIVAPLMIRCMGEIAHCSAVVMPDDSEPLLGAIPLEEMNLIIDLQRLELIPSPRFQKMVGYRILD